MVNATVTNDPVSIVLDGGQSTTVPPNETWRVSIYLGTFTTSNITIDGVGVLSGNSGNSSQLGLYTDVTLTGGQTIAETNNDPDGIVFITGFVVNS